MRGSGGCRVFGLNCVLASAFGQVGSDLFCFQLPHWELFLDRDPVHVSPSLISRRGVKWELDKAKTRCIHWVFLLASPLLQRAAPPSQRWG